MESILTTVYNAAGHFGPIGSFFLLIALMVERAFDRGWLRFGDNIETANERVQLKTLMEKLLENQGTLQAHYNDETTELLESLVSGQARSISLIERTADAVKEGFKATEDKFKEYDKYGIKAVVVK